MYRAFSSGFPVVLFLRLTYEFNPKQTKTSVYKDVHSNAAYSSEKLDLKWLMRTK